MATALTVYPTGTADTLVATANTLATSAPAAETSHTTKTGKLTAWGVLFAQGTANAWAAGASEPTFGNVNGFILDSTLLENKTFLAGTWSCSIKISTSSGTVTAVAHIRVGKRSSGGVFTQIVDMAAAGTGFTSVAATVTATGSGAATSFDVGDKLYIEIDLNISANSSASTTATTSLFENGGTAESVVTPGYVAAKTGTGTSTTAGSGSTGPIKVTGSGHSITAGSGSAGPIKITGAGHSTTVGSGTGSAQAGATIVPATGAGHSTTSGSGSAGPIKITGVGHSVTSGSGSTVARGLATGTGHSATAGSGSAGPIKVIGSGHSATSGSGVAGPIKIAGVGASATAGTGHGTLAGSTTIVPAEGIGHSITSGSGTAPAPVPVPTPSVGHAGSTQGFQTRRRKGLFAPPDDWWGFKLLKRGNAPLNQDALDVIAQAEVVVSETARAQAKAIEEAEFKELVEMGLL